MNEIAAIEDTRESIQTVKDMYLDPADWRISTERRKELQSYQDSLENSPASTIIGASEYEPPQGTQYDITKVSKSLGIRCLQLKTNRFAHKVPLDRILKSLELARPHDNPSKVAFPYGFTENNQFKITNVIMPLSIFENLSRSVSRNFKTEMVYNQNSNSV